MNNKDKVTVVRPGETVKFGKATVTNKTKQTKYYGDCYNTITQKCESFKINK